MTGLNVGAFSSAIDDDAWTGRAHLRQLSSGELVVMASTVADHTRRGRHLASTHRLPLVLDATRPWSPTLAESPRKAFESRELAQAAGPQILIAPAPIHPGLVREVADADLVMIVGATTDPLGDIHCESMAEAVECVEAFVRICGRSIPHDASPVSALGTTPRSIVPFSLDESYDTDALLQAILDDGRWLELAAHRGPEAIIGVGTVAGHAVTVMANRSSIDGGRVTSIGLRKIRRCLEFAENRRLPVISLIDTEGVGSIAPADLTSLLAAIHDQTLGATPRIPVLAGRAFGLGAMAMGAFAESAHLVAWPRAELGNVMPEELDEPSEDAVLQMHDDASALHAAEDGHLFHLIDPNDTRSVIAGLLELIDHG